MNLIYFHTHDSGRYFRHYGRADAPTKHISRWALEEALSFRNAFTPSPTCSPSRAALLTGTYPHNNGMLGLAHRGFSLGNYREHLVSLLGEHGYHTVLSGVQHEAAGCFDHTEGATRIGYKEDITADLHFSEHKHQDANNSPICSDKRSSRAGDQTAAWDRKNALRAAEWLSQEQKNPFFLSLGMFGTHREYPSLFGERFSMGDDAGEAGNIQVNGILPPPGTADTEANRIDHARFLTSLRNVDENFQILMEALKRSPHADRTIVLFTTDHGLALPFHKCSLNGSGSGVALSLAIPGKKSASPWSDALISTIDILPTLCDLLGIPVPSHTEGKSFSRLLDRPEMEHRTHVFGEVNFHTSYQPMRSIRTKRYSFVKHFDRSYPFTRVSNIDISPPRELLLDHGLAEEKVPLRELYDLVRDPLEMVNLAGEPGCQETTRLMERMLTEWQRDSDDPLLEGTLHRPAGSVVNCPECRDPDSKNPEDYLPSVE